MTAARRLFFEGGRRIPSTGRHREALLTGGLPALAAEPPPAPAAPGPPAAEWETIHRHGWLTPAALDRIDQRGALPAAGAPDFAVWIGAPHRLTHDDQTGSIGGGNHFVELQRVERILDRRTAWAWGLRPGDVAVMVHTGSVGIGHIAGRAIRELLRAAWPAGTPHPENGIYPLPAEGARVADRFWQLLANAANFAFANRLFLAAMAVRAIEETVGRLAPGAAPLVYDAPHNLIWREPDGRYLHRKGATPARGREAMAGTPFEAWGEPVLVPGSMGAPSYLLAGEGNPDALASASHGAGRALSRGDASRTGRAEFAKFLEDFRVVTPLDLRRPEIRHRRDILERKLDELRAEGPHAYKGIEAVIATLSAGGLARPVAELVPLATVKG